MHFRSELLIPRLGGDPSEGQPENRYHKVKTFACSAKLANALLIFFAKSSIESPLFLHSSGERKRGGLRVSLVEVRARLGEKAHHLHRDHHHGNFCEDVRRFNDNLCKDVPFDVSVREER